MLDLARFTAIWKNGRGNSELPVLRLIFAVFGVRIPAPPPNHTKVKSLKIQASAYIVNGVALLLLSFPLPKSISSRKQYNPISLQRGSGIARKVSDYFPLPFTRRLCMDSLIRHSYLLKKEACLAFICALVKNRRHIWAATAYQK
jgi:hypothetical protein